jgi:hypothetical protein
MTLAKAEARANKTFTVQASFTIVTYNRQNIFVQLGFSVSKVTDKKFT